MLNRRSLILAAATASILAHSPFANAAERMSFTPQAFEAAQKAGSPILVDISAPWCPTCKAQKPIVSQLTSTPRFKDLKIFDVDFDSQKDAVRAFNARTQSTLIVFKGAQETARSVGDTIASSIASLLDKAI